MRKECRKRRLSKGLEKLLRPSPFSRWRKPNKVLTDRKGKTFRWVKEGELQSYIESKAAKFVGVPKRKAAKL